MTAVGARREISRSTAVRFVVLLGIVSLFADTAYEGARSINGPYLALLGASGLIVGFVSGLGELIGYTLRLVSGYLVDRTRRYWAITILGYALNLGAVPALALAGHWPAAMTLMILERAGKGLRNPPRDAMLSHATYLTGRGWGFGLHEAMDQIGAVAGPLLVAAIVYFRHSYQVSYVVLLVPAVLAFGAVLLGRFLYPSPRDFEVAAPRLETRGFPRAYWVYILGAGLLAAGFADFPLIAFHFQQARIASDAWIPILYAIAMAVDAGAALLFGNLFDRLGLSVLVISTLVSAAFAPLVFFGGFTAAMLGMAVWGIGMGAHESVLGAAIAEMVPADRRGSAYGVFNTGFGIFWFLGSWLMGYLYDRSILWLVVFSVVAQLAAVPVLYAVARMSARPRAA